MQNIIALIVFSFLMALGYFAGSRAERSHYRSIEQREKEFLTLPAVTIRKAADDDADINQAEMVYGNAVISVDYFKRFVAGLRNIFGGTVKSYESLIDRARREALLRMKEMAPPGSSVIINVRIETSRIGNTSKKNNTVTCVEAMAYGTAIVLKDKK